MNQHYSFISKYSLNEYSFDLRHCFADDMLRFDNLRVDGEPMNDEDLTTSQYSEIISHLDEYRYELL